MSPRFADLRIGYAPVSADFDGPGDRRRFVGWARARDVRFERADPRERYDVVVVSAKGDLAAWTRARGRVVLDLVDAYLDVAWWDPRDALRGLAKRAAGELSRGRVRFSRAVAELCARADAVVCGCPEQARSIAPWSTNVHPILDLLDEYDGAAKGDWRAHDPLRLVWEGLPHNARHLDALRGPLAALAGKRPVEIHVVTAPAYHRVLGRFGRRDTRADLAALPAAVVFREWTAAAVREVATRSDLAVLPIPLADPFSRGRPENKLLAFWRMGVPAIASATPAYARAMRAAGLGPACANDDDWTRALESLLIAPDAEARRRAHAEAGAGYARAQTAREALLSRWDAALESALSRSRS